VCVDAEAPCLSFDVVSDELGSGREEFPLTCYFVSGTQASRAQANSVIVMKLTNLCKTQRSDDDDDEDDRLILQVLHNCFLVHVAFIRMNFRAIAMMFVCLYVWDGHAL